MAFYLAGTWKRKQIEPGSILEFHLKGDEYYDIYVDAVIEPNSRYRIRRKHRSPGEFINSKLDNAYPSYLIYPQCYHLITPMAVVIQPIEWI